MFKAAVFDAYGTLFKLPESNELLQELIGERSNELLRYWRQKQLAYTWQRTLMNRYAPFEKVSEDALRHTLDVFGLENKALYEDLMQTLWQPELFPEVKGVLTDLTNQGLQVAILSNGSTGLLKSAVEHHQLGGLFDQIISAHSVSKFKPHPKVYQLAEDSLDCYADELSFQSSNAWDAIGASQYGLFTVWINRNKSHLDRLDTRVDKELSDLSGLPTLMGK